MRHKCISVNVSYLPNGWRYKLPHLDYEYFWIRLDQKSQNLFTYLQSLFFYRLIFLKKKRRTKHFFKTISTWDLWTNLNLWTYLHFENYSIKFRTYTNQIWMLLGRDDTRELAMKHATKSIIKNPFSIIFAWHKWRKTPNYFSLLPQRNYYNRSWILCTYLQPPSLSFCFPLCCGYTFSSGFICIVFHPQRSFLCWKMNWN